MSKTGVKKTTISELKEKLARSGLAVVTNYRGFTTGELAELRSRLRKSNADYKVAKNTLIKVAIKDTNLSELEKLLEGPTALLLGYGEPTACAKTFVEFVKETEKGDIKGGVFEGKLLTKQEIKTFASLPSKDVLLGQIAGLLVANTRDIAGIFESLIRDIAILAEEVAKKSSK